MIDQFLKMKEHVVGGWKTTAVGFIIVGASLATVFMDKASWIQASAPLLIGSILFITPDPKKKEVENE